YGVRGIYCGLSHLVLVAMALCHFMKMHLAHSHELFSFESPLALVEKTKKPGPFLIFFCVWALCFTCNLYKISDLILTSNSKMQEGIIMPLECRIYPFDQPQIDQSKGIDHVALLAKGTNITESNRIIVIECAVQDAEGIHYLFDVVYTICQGQAVTMAKRNYKIQNCYYLINTSFLFIVMELYLGNNYLKEFKVHIFQNLTPPIYDLNYKVELFQILYLINITKDFSLGKEELVYIPRIFYERSMIYQLILIH
ncbi:hypothetical protein ACJX0J_033962, partial [Zea mays]